VLVVVLEFEGDVLIHRHSLKTHRPERVIKVSTPKVWQYWDSNIRHSGNM
jgi:hypothetical protein